jgi:hypothetical protein
MTPVQDVTVLPGAGEVCAYLTGSRATIIAAESEIGVRQVGVQAGPGCGGALARQHRPILSQTATASPA